MTNKGRTAQLLVLVVASVLLPTFQCDQIDFKNPVRSADQDEIKSLLGLNYTLNFKQYSGYLEADTNSNRFYHYWFTESQSNPNEDPLVLWLNGGPGCSSLLGLLTELGPFYVSTGYEVKQNPFAWNKRANVIFLESPSGVGFSYAVDGDVKADDDTTARQNHQALRSFFKKFPQYKGRPLYLTGESYGGVYLPTLAVLVDADPEMNLKGVAIGNGYLDATKLAESLVYFSYYHGLIGRTVWDGLSKYCCGGRAPARGQCNFFSQNRTEECDGSVLAATDSILQSGINPYNLYDKCAGSGKELQSGEFKATREHFDKSLLIHAFKAKQRTRHSSIRKQKFSILRNDPPCVDEGLQVRYLNRHDVREALHVPKEVKNFDTCFDGIQYTMIYPGSKDGLAPQIRKLLASSRKLNLLVYNGDTDLMCNFFGDEWFVDDLNLPLLADYQPWHVNGQVAGFVKHYEGITYMTVKGSGHMVPGDKPAEALAMFETFLYGHEK